MLLAGNAAHADIPVDATGSTIMAWVLAMIGQSLGYPVPRGGAGRLSGALVERLASRGGRLVVGTRATRVVVRDGRAVGVEVSGGEFVGARRAVLAGLRSGIDQSASMWLHTSSCRGMVKYRATKTARSKPGRRFSSQYRRVMVAGAFFGTASTNVLPSGKTRCICTSSNSWP